MKYFLTTPADVRRVALMLGKLDYSHPWVVTVEGEDEFRTAQANAYYWQVIVGAVVRWEASKGHDVDKEIVHQWLKSERWGMDVQQVMGTVIWKPKHTRRLSKAEFSEYVDWATAHIIEKGVPAEYLEGNPDD